MLQFIFFSSNRFFKTQCDVIPCALSNKMTLQHSNKNTKKEKNQGVLFLLLRRLLKFLHIETYLKIIFQSILNNPLEVLTGGQATLGTQGNNSHQNHLQVVYF